MAVHQHNEAEAAQAVIERLRQGQRVAYASDAGTPAVSDPGARLVSAVREAGLRVVPLPGASSVTAALSVAGAMGDEGAFVFAGFLPAKATEREAAVAVLANEARAVVLLEAPHRIEALARSLAALGARPVTVGRELTKQFEEVATVPCGELPAWLSADSQRTPGRVRPGAACGARGAAGRRGPACAGAAAQGIAGEERGEAGGGDHRRAAQRAL